MENYPHLSALHAIEISPIENNNFIVVEIDRIG